MDRTITKNRIKLIRALRNIGSTSAELSLIRLKALNISRQIRSNHNDYLALSSDDPTGKVSYATRPEYRYDQAHRTKTTFGRYVRKRLNISTDEIDDNTLAQISALLFGHTTDAKADITIISGQAITDAYINNFGGSSCMTGNNSDYVAIYADNPDKVSLVQYRNSINARALLWTANCGTRILDRIYPNDGQHIPALHKWAIDNNIIHRSYNSLPNGDHVRLSDSADYEVTLKHQGTFPYMDTFCWADEVDGNSMTVSNSKDGCFNIVLQDTAGGHSEQQQCGNCNGSVDDEEAYSMEGQIWCSSCYDDHFTCCENCYETVGNDEMVQVTEENGYDDYICEDCARSKYYQCDHCQEWHAILTETEQGHAYCDDHINSYAKMCDGCNEWHEENTTETEDSEETYCPDCLPDNAEKCQVCKNWFEYGVTEHASYTEICEDCKEEKTPNNCLPAMRGFIPSQKPMQSNNTRVISRIESQFWIDLRASIQSARAS